MSDLELDRIIADLQRRRAELDRIIHDLREREAARKGEQPPEGDENQHDEK